MQHPHWSSIVSFIDHLHTLGYAVAVFTPEELGKASADKVASHMIDHGWQMIDAENATPVEDRIDLFDPTTDTTKFTPPRSMTVAQKPTREEWCAWATATTPEEDEAWRELEKKQEKEEDEPTPYQLIADELKPIFHLVNITKEMLGDPKPDSAYKANKMLELAQVCLSRLIEELQR